MKSEIYMVVRRAPVVAPVWAVFYETAIVARCATKRDAYIQHDALVCAGLDPDKLAWGELTERERDAS